MESELLQWCHQLDVGSFSSFHLPLNLMQVFNEDILGDIKNAWDHFVQTGQVWALVIGFVIGYILKALMSY